MANPHNVSLHDIGDFPSSIIATQIAEDSRDFCALRLCCKAAYGAEIPTHSSIPNRDATDQITSQHCSSSHSVIQPCSSTSHPVTSRSSTSQPHQSVCQTGLSRQTTRLHLSSRVFLAPTAHAKHSASLCRATKLLCRHSAVTDLSISHSHDNKTSTEFFLQAVPDALPRLSRLSIILGGYVSLHDGMQVIHTELASACLARLHCLTHLTLQLCRLGSGFSEVLAQLQHLTELNLDSCFGIGELAVVGLAAVRSISVVQTDVTKLVLSNCGAVHELDASASSSLISCCISSCLRLSILNLSCCGNLPYLDVRSCVELECLDISECDLLTELLAAGCSKLSTLSASLCDEMTSLDITGCSALEVVSMSHQAPEQLDPSVHILVKKLMVRRSWISFLPALPAIKDLKLAECNQLEVLDLCSHHQLRIVNLHMCNALVYLGLPSGLQQLCIAYCSCLLALDTSLLSQLQSLTLQGCNGILQLNVSCLEHLTSLQVLHCNSMQTLMVSNCPVISSIEVISSCLAELNVTQLPLLAKLDVSSPSASSIQGDVAALKLSLHDCPALRSLTAKHTGLATLDVSSLTSLRVLDVSGDTALTEVNAAGCACLNNLVLTGCSSIQRLDLTRTTKLRSLGLAGCIKLVDTNPQLLDGTTLHYLHLSFTITMPSLSALAELKQLNMEGCNEVITMDFSYFPELQSLIVTACPLLQQLDVASLEHLRYLSIKDCKSLTQIGGTWPEGITRTFSPVYGGNLPNSLSSEIRQLSLTNCPVQSLDLAFFPCLKELCVQNCHKLLTLDTRDCRGLHILKIAACNALSTVSFFGTMFLYSLELRELSRLQHLRFDGCTSLQQVSIHDSALVELDFQGSHRITSLTFSKLPFLERVVAVDLPFLSSLWISGSSKLSTLHIVGSTKRLESLYIDHESPLGTIDLVQAPLLRAKYLSKNSHAECAVCMEGTISHAFLHSTFVHGICSRCAQKLECSSAVGEGSAPNLKACLVCSRPCQFARVRV